MKKIILSLLVTSLGFFGLVKAEGGGFHAGFQGNYHATFIINSVTVDTIAVPGKNNAVHNPYSSFKNKLGWMAGLAIGYDINDIVGFQTEVNLSKQGCSNYGKNETIERDINLTYLQIPLLFKLMSGGDGSRAYLLLGPQYSMLQKAEMILTKTDKTPPTGAKTYSDGTVIDLKAEERVLTSDLGIVMGLGSDIKVSDFFYISAGLRLYYSLDELQTEKYQRYSTSENATYEKRNNAFGGLNIGFHYRFGAEKK